MENNPETFDTIEGYINNRLSQEERAAFEKEMIADPELHLEVEKHRAIHKTLSNKDTLEFKEKLIHITQKIEQQNKTTTAMISPALKIAASIIIILAVGTLLWYTLNNQNQTQDLYATYYTPFTTEDVTRGEIDNDFQKIVQSYSKGNYQKVIPTLEEIIKTNRQEVLKLYLANSYLNTNQEEKAITLFEGIQKNSSYYEVARWYLSLTYIKLNQTNTAIPVLEEVIVYDGIYKNNAIQLKKALLH